MRTLAVVQCLLFAGLLSTCTTLPAYESDSSVVRLVARELASFPAPQGVQGVAVDESSYFIVTDSKITRHDKQTGDLKKTWARGAEIGANHLNSCKVYGAGLICSNSNYPQVPMASSVEFFDKESLAHRRSHSLGILIGSLTWLDRKGDDDWWAGFAHYSGEGGTPGKGTSWTSLVSFDEQWRRTGGWIFPDSVIERMEPFSASGGAWGPDGLLYITGHDLPEMYVLRLPEAGSVLEHVATISIAAEGQAFSWDRSTDERIVYAVSRSTQRIIAFEIPKIPGAR